MARAVVGAPIEELVISPNLISPNLISPNLNASPKAAPPAKDEVISPNLNASPNAAPPAKDEASKKIQALMRARAAKAYVSALKAGQQVIMRSP